MTAREKFQPEMRVRMTAEGERVLLRHANRRASNRVKTGTVKGFSRNPELVRIRRDEHLQLQRYHINFWEPIPHE